MKSYIPLVLSSLILFLSCSDDEVTSAPEPTTLESKINQYLELEQSESSPGLSIAVRKGNEIMYMGNKGLARADVKQSINSETQFRIGSITKPMTAIAVMQLIEKGLLSLDDKLLSFYPELPDSFENITISHLLSHRSGLLDYIEDNTNLEALDNLNMQDALAFISDPNSGFENLTFQPGTMGRYSNTGYVLLALIIEKITDMTLPGYLDQYVFDPAGMENTFVISENEHLGDHGENYALSFGTNKDVLGFNSLIYGASGVVSTSDDMLLFVNALLSNQLISEESLNLMTQTVGSLPNIETDYGLGWLTGTGNYWHTDFITDPNDYWHSGGFDGYRTVLSINPTLNYEVIVLSNGGDDTTEKMWKILEIARKHYKNQ